jgi:hypothetical protein
MKGVLNSSLRLLSPIWLGLLGGSSRVFGGRRFVVSRHLPKRASWMPRARPSIGWLSRLPEWMAHTSDRWMAHSSDRTNDPDTREVEECAFRWMELWCPSGHAAKELSRGRSSPGSVVAPSTASARPPAPRATSARVAGSCTSAPQRVTAKGYGCPRGARSCASRRWPARCWAPRRMTHVRDIAVETLKVHCPWTEYYIVPLAPATSVFVASIVLFRSRFPSLAPFVLGV